MVTNAIALAGEDFATHHPATVIRYFDRIDRARGKYDSTTPFITRHEFPELAIFSIEACGFLEAKNVQIKGTPKTRPNFRTRIVS